ncbi:MAG: 1,6-anhydro-N-acetylmuramyl-L-alanine amidase AmpD [Pseudomonadales bacterium]|nr:1,6-anhydro-N-acetylmuramyl-L-alanine amidase AmpD [Pseudomonadales bacterium]
MEIKDHWLVGAKQVPSPNCNERPVGIEPDLIVIHCISLPPGQYGSNHIEQFFQNCLCADEHPYFEEIHKMEVSSHLLIRRDGEIVQFVPFNQRAWHAGKSCYGERENCNDFSIGIELEGTDDSAYEPVQYERLKQVIETLVSHYPKIKPDALVGHSDIAPGRKTDPGPHFDWDKLNKALGLS